MSNHRSKVAESEERWKRHKGLEKLRADTERIENTLLRQERDELLEAADALLKAVEDHFRVKWADDVSLPAPIFNAASDYRALLSRIQARGVDVKS